MQVSKFTTRPWSQMSGGPVSMSGSGLDGV
jgi:hypothetical protein